MAVLMFSLPGWVELLAVLILVLVIAAVFFAVVKTILSVAARVFRGGPGCDCGDAMAGGLVGWSRGVKQGAGCPNAKCRQVNAAGAKYCARCGWLLSGAC